MEEIAFSDWPGQPVDLNSGNNPWLPAYGFTAPSALLERDDFIGNPDAEYFLHSGFSHYMYLETILEETSDDLQSESDTDSRGSPVGWLATDSEAGSVICIEPPDEVDCESDRELACPAKRRKQDFFLNLPNPDEDLSSLSRSSSLLQFETLEKQCQETCSQYSFDSLESNIRKHNLSPDSLNSPKSDDTEDESEFYKTLKIDVPTRKQRSNDSLLYSANRSSGSDTSESDGIDISRSFDNLKPWRSYDSLPVNKIVRDKVSAENLSEDSGYSDHLTKSSSTNSFKTKDDIKVYIMKSYPEKKNSYVGFSAYDGDVLNENFNGNFGVSYQDLTILRDPELDNIKSSQLIDIFIKNKKQRASLPINVSTKILNLDSNRECGRSPKSNFKSSSSSEPNLLHDTSTIVNQSPNICISSVPKDLNFIADFSGGSSKSVAVKNWNLADFRPGEYEEMSQFKRESSYAEAIANSSYKREGSYAEAMANRVDLSDDEHSLYNKNKPKLPKTPIVEFDKKVLNAISEQSLISSTQNLNNFLEQIPVASTPKRNVVSTPNLALENQVEVIYDDERRKSVQDISRKGSIIKSSTSTSGLSDNDDKLASVKSFNGSTNSKGVHFSPVVSEVNWRDDSVSTATPERESSYSLGSSTPERVSPARVIVKPRAVRLSHSQPDLSDNEVSKKEFVSSLKSLRQDFSKSQPDVNRFRRRASQLIKKDKDGSLVKSYIDRDGIQYKHTHLDIGSLAPHHDNPNTGGEQPDSAFKPIRSVVAMEPRDAQRVAAHAPLKDAKQSKTSGKFGGFFSRLASFRFSLRKGAEEKAKLKKKKTSTTGTGNAQVSVNTMTPQQRVASKSDYIYIPLKGPPNPIPNQTSNSPISPNNSTPKSTNSLTSKPPLPKQPPRIVHASVKPSAAAAAHEHRQHRTTASNDNRQHRRRTIDSTSGGPLSMEPMGLIETDLDTEVTVITSSANVKTRSLLDLGPQPHRLTLAADQQGKEHPHRARPHKSMEFLLDKQNLKVVEPPENELQKGERVMSEHQLRVQRSLQKLTIPDWYKQSPVPREGFLLKKQSPRESRWNGTGSKTTSLSSLGSNTFSPIVSPTPLTQPFVRWSTSKLNSTASSPCASTRSSFNTRQPNGSISPSSVRSSFSYRQPYLGWRSQERISRPRTPAERLASSLLATQQTQESPEIQTSIKEVTSAIVHYVSGLRPEDARDKSYDSQETASQRSSSVSPRGSQKLCWLESSFVGTRPLDSPQTPVTLSESQSQTPVSSTKLRLDLQTHNG